MLPANWSRRQLLLASAAAAIGARAATVKLPRKVRLGLIGYDGHPEEILRPLADFPDVELAAVADAGSDPRAIESTLRNPFARKAHRYTDYGEMLNREQLDCVAICNHNGGRAAAIAACAARKLDLIAEKPFAINRRDLASVIAAVETHRVHAGMLLPMRFDPPYLAMKQIVDSGETGEISQIDAQKSYQLDTRPDWQKHTATYGSTILWIGIHMIDLMSFTSGRSFTQAASFQGHAAFPELGDMQNVTATIFRLDNGGTATLRMDYLRPASVKGHGDDRLRLAGSKGIVEYQEETGVTVLSAAGRRVLTALPPAGSVFGDFLRSTYLGEKPALSWQEIVRANQWTMAAQEASESGRVIAIR
ncbi:MAG TPA: Gfo/Idh/MocA family oxidoreductase [Candidatus Acidoferrales bacterium]|nr:Gfo/Idh/MocA family oxidoreductase [Candidatus Acidoferrales bacterium]